MRLKRLGLIALAGCISCGTLTAQDESTNDVYNQIASMEYKQWSFTPKWYYYNKYWGTVINMPWPLPDVKGWIAGIGMHDKQGWVTPTLPYVPYYNFIGDNYVNEKWRQMYPHRLTASAEAEVQAGHTDDEREFWNDINITDVALYTDRSTDLPGVGAQAVPADDRAEYNQRILDHIYNIRRLGGQQNTRIADELRMEYDVIREEISIVGSAHERNANRLRTLQSCNNRLRRLAEKAEDAYAVLRLAEEPWLKRISNYNRKWRRKTVIK